MCSAVFEAERELDPQEWPVGPDSATVTGSDPPGPPTPTEGGWRALRRVIRGVDVLIHRGPSSRPHPPDECEAREFLQLYGAFQEEFRPDVVLSFGGDALATGARRLARAGGAACVFALHNSRSISI
jgi:hypothetical protein